MSGWASRSCPPCSPDLYILATALAELGRLEDALRVGQEGVDIAESVDDPWTKSVASCYLGYVRLRKRMS